MITYSINTKIATKSVITLTTTATITVAAAAVTSDTKGNIEIEETHIYEIDGTNAIKFIGIIICAIFGRV